MLSSAYGGSSESGMPAGQTAGHSDITACKTVVNTFVRWLKSALAGGPAHKGAAVCNGCLQGRQQGKYNLNSSAVCSAASVVQVVAHVPGTSLECMNGPVTSKPSHRMCAAYVVSQQGCSEQQVVGLPVPAAGL